MPNIEISSGLQKLDFLSNEAINTLRGNIQMSGLNIQTIALTSCNAGEGKSSLSFRLAESLSKLNKKVVYLDCDIRNSKFKRRYSVTEKTAGLSDYLCGHAGILDIVYKSDVKDLFVIFAGSHAPNPSELLSSNLFSVLLNNLKSLYDYVIVDTPPVNVVVDATLIAPQCDAAILVAENSVTDKRDLTKAKQQLEHANAKILGVVLNRVPRGIKGYGKYYRYGRYGRYGKYGYGKYGKYGKYGYGKYGKYGYGENHTSGEKNDKYIEEIDTDKKGSEK